MVEAGVTAMVFLSAAGGAGWHRRHGVKRLTNINDKIIRFFLGTISSPFLWRVEHSREEVSSMPYTGAEESSLQHDERREEEVTGELQGEMGVGIYVQLCSSNLVSPLSLS